MPCSRPSSLDIWKEDEASRNHRCGSIDMEWAQRQNLVLLSWNELRKLLTPPTRFIKTSPDSVFVPIPYQWSSIYDGCIKLPSFAIYFVQRWHLKWQSQYRFRHLKWHQFDREIARHFAVISNDGIFWQARNDRLKMKWRWQVLDCRMRLRPSRPTTQQHKYLCSSFSQPERNKAKPGQQAIRAPETINSPTTTAAVVRCASDDNLQAREDADHSSATARIKDWILCLIQEQSS